MLKKIRSPRFWNNSESVLSKCLLPLAKLYYAVSNYHRNSVTPKQLDIPVICVGSVLISGAGKTPAVDLVCRILKDHAFNPHILTSSDGGYLKNVVRVDPSVLSYLQVGDESLLSALVAPTWIGKNRIKASAAAIASGADAIIIDDGFRNNSLVKNYKLLVVDSEQQFANENLFPAGPLIEPVESGVNDADTILIIGEKNEALETRIKSIRNDIAIFRAKMKVDEALAVDNNKVVAFCGLGYPKKFRRTLMECNYEIVDFIEFSDHHPYTITEIQHLINRAKTANATLITTMKDYVKIPDVFTPEIKVISIKLETENNDLADDILKTIEPQAPQK